MIFFDKKICALEQCNHQLCFTALSMGLCVSMIALLRLPSLKVSCLLLSGLLIYDVFWVFFSSYIFNANVMVQVATAQADNPVSTCPFFIHFLTAIIAQRWLVLRIVNVQPLYSSYTYSSR